MINTAKEMAENKLTRMDAKRRKDETAALVLKDIGADARTEADADDKPGHNRKTNTSEKKTPERADGPHGLRRVQSSSF